MAGSHLRASGVACSPLLLVSLVIIPRRRSPGHCGYVALAAFVREAVVFLSPSLVTRGCGPELWLGWIKWNDGDKEERGES